jgi:photosystem II stability/assembly factor-like uncharacterized protein
MKKFKYFSFILLFFICHYSDSSSQWIRANAGVDGGIIFSVYANPLTNNIFCGSNGSGAFKSTNGGENWIPVNNGISDYGFYPTCFSSIPGFTFMGTSYSSTYGAGIYRTSNEGASWQKINSGLNSPKALRINKSISRGSEVFITTDSGVYRSSNNGNNWIHITSSINSVPKADGIFFKGDTLYIGTTSGVYFSSGSFASWTQANTGLPSSAAMSFVLYNGNLYCAIFGSGVYVSSNNGASWSSANYNLTGSLLNLRCVYVFNNTLYVSCNGGIFTLGSNTWNSVSGGLPTDYPYFYWLTSLPGKLITCTYAKGVYITTDNGTMWNQKVSGLTSSGLYFKKIINIGTTLYAATGNYGVYKSSDNGLNWISSNNNNPLHCNNLSYIDNKIFLQSDSGVYSSTNLGTTWNAMNNGLNGNDLKVYCMMKSGTTYFIGGYNGILKSTDNGQSWLPSSFYATQKNVMTLNQLNGILWAGMGNGSPTLIKSTDAGNTWINSPFYTSFSPEVFDIFIEGNDLYLGTGHGVHRTTNNGLNWTMLNDGLGGDPYVSSIIRVGTNLFCTQMFGGRGVYRSHNNGSNWVDVTGIPFLFTDFNQVLNWNGNIFLATSSALFYQPQELLTGVTSTPEIVRSFSLEQNYPNPFNPVTNIKFSLKNNGNISLKVFDITGKTVKELINDYRQAGEYNINFNGNELSSGVYFYTMKINDFSETRKMILMK